MPHYENLRRLHPDQNYYKWLVHQLSVVLFVLNYSLAGGFAIFFPQYITEALEAPPEGYQYFLPAIYNWPEDASEEPPADIRDNRYCQQQFPEKQGYTLNEQEAIIEQLLLTDPGQEHEHLEHSIALSQAARGRAQDMADRAYFSHTNPDGYGPNCIVLQQEFVLPDGYDFSSTANNVETIAGGYSDMPEAWNGLLSSEHHANHLLGHGEFYGEQRYYGIGYVYIPGSQFGHYLVIIISDKKEN